MAGAEYGGGVCAVTSESGRRDGDVSEAGLGLRARGVPSTAGGREWCVPRAGSKLVCVLSIIVGQKRWCKPRNRHVFVACVDSCTSGRWLWCVSGTGQGLDACIVLCTASLGEGRVSGAGDRLNACEVAGLAGGG